MRIICRSFWQMLFFVKRDMMLLAACAAPILAGLAIRLGIPFLESMLVKWVGLPMILTPFFGLFDLFYAMLAPTMFCFVTAMVMLEEHDDRIDVYLFVTGLGKSGYLVSRIFLPAGIAFVVTLVLLPLFRLTGLTALEILFLSLTGTLQGGIIGLLIVTLSTNKLEGMAITKMATMMMLGAFLPYFVSHPVQYVAAILPSFWAAKAIYEQNILFMLPALGTAGIWLWSLLRAHTMPGSSFRKPIS